MGERKKSKPEQVDVMTLTELEQVRVLADPLRLRIVEKLCDDELTTKQVAETLGEKPTKLYHHVEALEKIGLIRQTRTKRNRGTLERYYIAVARRFKADAGLFAGDTAPPGAEPLQSVVSTIVETTARELGDLAAHADVPDAEKGLLSFLYLEADQSAIDRIQRRLQKLLKDIAALDGNKKDPTQRKYRMTLAFYPLDANERKSN